MLREMEESETDPLTFEERKAIIIRHLAERGYEHKISYEIISVPNITHITYGRNVGYKIEKEELGEELEKISGTEERTTFSTLREYFARGATPPMKYFCAAPWTHTYVSPQGERRLCCATEKRDLSKNSILIVEPQRESLNQYH